MLLSLTPLLALTGAGRPVLDAHLLAEAAVEAATRPTGDHAVDDDSEPQDAPIIICVEDPWDRVIRAGGFIVGVEPITIATAFTEPIAPVATSARRPVNEWCDYTPAQATHLARLWSCGPPIA